MALLDRFRAQPRQKHADPAVRLAFVQELPISEREVLAEIVREDADARVRRAAAAKLLDPTVDAVDRIAEQHPGAGSPGVRNERGQIAARAKNKSAAKRARTLVREMDERAGREADEARARDAEAKAAAEREAAARRAGERDAATIVQTHDEVERVRAAEA